MPEMSNEVKEELANLAQALHDNPSTHKDFLRLSKVVRPEFNPPELAHDERMTEMETRHRGEIEKLNAKLAEKDNWEELGRRRKALIDSNRAADIAEVEKIEEVMLSKGINNHETGADYWQWMQQAAAPSAVNYDRSLFNEQTRKTLQGFWKNPTQMARQMAQQAIIDFRKNPKIAMR